MRTANYTDFRKNLRSHLDSVTDDCEPLVVSRQGHGSVVVISLEAYNNLTETEYIMSSPEMMEVIREGRRQMAAGEGETVHLDNLWK